jgi:hypothetical protein
MNKRAAPAPAAGYSSLAVAGFLKRLPPNQFQIVVALRRLIRATAPASEESVCWGSLSYHRPNVGGRVAGAVCLVTSRPDGVELGFIHGAALRDSHRLLQGTGKAKRFIPIRSLQDVRREGLHGLVRAAAAYNPRTSIGGRKNVKA